MGRATGTGSALRQGERGTAAAGRAACALLEWGCGLEAGAHRRASAITRGKCMRATRAGPRKYATAATRTRKPCTPKSRKGKHTMCADCCPWGPNCQSLLRALQLICRPLWRIARRAAGAVPGGLPRGLHHDNVGGGEAGVVLQDGHEGEATRRSAAGVPVEAAVGLMVGEDIAGNRVCTASLVGASQQEFRTDKRNSCARSAHERR